MNKNAQSFEGNDLVKNVFVWISVAFSSILGLIFMYKMAVQLEFIPAFASASKVTDMLKGLPAVMDWVFPTVFFIILILAVIGTQTELVSRLELIQKIVYLFVSLGFLMFGAFVSQELFLIPALSEIMGLMPITTFFITYSEFFIIGGMAVIIVAMILKNE